MVCRVWSGGGCPLFMMYRMSNETNSFRAPNARSPFVRLRELLGDTPPGKPAISLAVGEPQHAIPSFVGPVIAAHVNEFGRYPMNKGLDAFSEAVAGWLNKRFALERPVDPLHEVLVLNGTREGLFLAALAAKNYVPQRAGKPAVLIPNPFYAAYSAGAIAADCEPVYLPATKATGFLPDLDALSDELLSRTVAVYLASPSNPQGAVADLGYLEKLADFEFEGREVLASRLGYRITASFVDRFLGRIFEMPGSVFPVEMLRPEKQNLADFAEGVNAIVDA